VVNQSIKSSAIAAQLVDRPGSASVQSRRNDNLYTGLVRLVSWLQFINVLRQNGMSRRHVDDELRETVVEERESDQPPHPAIVTMLRVEPFTVSPVIPTCSMYLRQSAN